MTRTRFAALAAATALLALAVILLGAYVRLSDAGLGCPDWPGCYGRLAVPADTQAVAAANAAFPQRPLETAKAWKEMLHRYLAGSLGLAILMLTLVAWRWRRSAGLPAGTASLLLALVGAQALLGMWTVTLLVKPLIVTAHLLGGMSTLALLWWLALRQGRPQTLGLTPELRRLRPWVWGGLLLVLGQLLLGGWTSSNYAALACTQFPHCHGDQWWPAPDFAEAFVLWRGLGRSYEFGVLSADARTAIHLSHRLGALLLLLYLGGLALRLRSQALPSLYRHLGLVLLGLLLVQIGLGLTNVLAQLPLPVAVAHNGGAALLLLTLVTLLHRLTPVPLGTGGARP
jgi:cytochrome c oxidase assembly protein subunit 15